MNAIVKPKIVDVGTVHGFCDARCIMCPIATMQTHRIMGDQKFESLIARLMPHNDEIVRINIVGMGETILDKNVVNKVKIAKKAKFSVGIVTNGHALNEKKSRQLLESGLDEMLFSIDSLNKETYEQIRVGLSYDRVIKNVHDFIRIRNEGKFNARIYVRIIVQEKNCSKQEAFVSYWNERLNVKGSDLVLAFPEHNWPLSGINPKAPVDQAVIDKVVSCAYVFDRLTIDAEGNVQFCCVDNEADFFNLGNVFESDPIELFNGPEFRNARNLMNAGRINEIDPCKYCNVPVKRLNRTVLSGAA